MHFPKTKQMQDIKSVCVCMCVCVSCIHGLKQVIVLVMRCSLTFGRKQSNSVMAFPMLTRMEKPLESDGIHPLIPYHNTIRSLSL